MQAEEHIHHSGAQTSEKTKQLVRPSRTVYLSQNTFRTRTSQKIHQTPNNQCVCMYASKIQYKCIQYVYVFIRVNVFNMYRWCVEISGWSRIFFGRKQAVWNSTNRIQNQSQNKNNGRKRNDIHINNRILLKTKISRQTGIWESLKGLNEILALLVVINLVEETIPYSGKNNTKSVYDSHFNH